LLRFARNGSYSAFIRALFAVNFTRPKPSPIREIRGIRSSFAKPGQFVKIRACAPKRFIAQACQFVEIFLPSQARPIVAKNYFAV